MLFMPFVGGVLADRVDRKKLLKYTEFALVILWAVVALVITLGWIRWWHLMISAVLSGIIQSIGRPGHQAMLGTVVEKDQLPTAVAIDSAADHWPRAVGLLIATLLIVTIGTSGVFWITAGGQLITGVTILFFQWNERPIEAGKQSVRSSMMEGFKYIRGEPVILGVVLLGAASSLFAGSYQFLMPFFARDILGVGAQGLGLLLLSSSIGVSFGAAAVFVLSKYPRRGLVLFGAAALYTVLILSFSRSHIYYLSIGIVFGMGIANVTTRAMVQMILQLMAPDHLRGRIVSLRVTIQGLSWIGVLIMGAIAEVIGAADTVLLGGAIYGLVILAMFVKMSSLRRMN